MKRTWCHVILLAGLVLLSCTASAQWIRTGSGMGRIYSVLVHPTDQQTMYAGSVVQGMYKSTDGGFSWTQINTGLLNTTVQAAAISRSNPNVVYCGTSQTGSSPGVYVSTDAGANWNFRNTGITEASISIQAIAIDPTNDSIAYIAIFDGLTNATNGIFKTTDQGNNWFVANNGIGRVKNFLSFAINPLNPNTMYGGSSFSVTAGDTEQARVYKSYDAGGTWFDVSAGLPPTKGTMTHDPVRALSMREVDTNRVLAGLFLNEARGGAFLTTNGGIVWTKMHNGIPNTVGTLLRSILIKPGSTSEFYVGLDRGGNLDIGVFRTNDGGQNWVSFNNGDMLNTYAIRTLAIRTDSAILYAGVAHPSDPLGQGVFRCQLTASYSANRSSIILPPVPVGSSSVDSFVVYCTGNTSLEVTATSANAVFTVSPDSTRIRDGDSARFYVTFSPDSARGYTGVIVLVHNGSSSPDSITVQGDGLTGVLGEEVIPVAFALEQNYPNPFNPSTTIRYALPKQSRALLRVYNLLGQEVSTLVNEMRQPGEHEVVFDAGRLPSGIYFYRLSTSSGFAETKKMALVR